MKTCVNKVAACGLTPWLYLYIRHGFLIPLAIVINGLMHHVVIRNKWSLGFDMLCNTTFVLYINLTTTHLYATLH